MLYLKRMAAIELRHLRYFIALAEEGSVTRAAERLGIQQPPLSQQLRALEDEIGTTLFKRSPRGITLTAAGDRLLQGARKILEAFEETIEETRCCGRGQNQRIVIGYTNSGGFNHFVPQAIRAFREDFPEISVALEESCSAELMNALRMRQVDIAFVRTPLRPSPGLSVRPLIDERMVAAVPKNHWLAANERSGSTPLKALSEETFILYRRPVGPGLYDVIIDACSSAGFAPRIGQEVPRIVGALNLVAAGLGITLVPSSMQRFDTKSVTYVALKDDVTLRAPIHLAFRTDDLSPAATSFSDVVINLAAKAPNELSTADRTCSEVKLAIAAAR